MPGTMENIATLNSVMRTILAVVILAILGGGGLIAYKTYNEGDSAKADLVQAEQKLADAQQRLAGIEAELTSTMTQLAQSKATIDAQSGQIEELEETVDEQRARIQRLEIAKRLLKKDHRRALIRVLDQTGTGDDMVTKLRWVELNDEGKIVDDREFELQGDIVKVDAWVVKFDDKYIEEEDLLRGTSICLFRRIHSEFPQRDEVQVLDEVGSLPSVYKRGEVSDFEREIWDDFWELHHNKDLAEDKGIRAVHGQVVYNKVRKGETYKIELRASDGLTIKPLGDDEPDPTAKPAA